MAFYGGYGDYETVAYDSEVSGAVPSGAFWDSVDDFNMWDVDMTQEGYENRINTEASMIVALEALREAMVSLDYDIENLEDCISDNDSGISDNDAGIAMNDSGIDDNDEEIDDQQYRVKRL